MVTAVGRSTFMGRSLRCRCLSPRGPSCEHHDRAREVDPDVSDSDEDEALALLLT